MGAEILADLLRGENFRVLFLGANTPPEAVSLALDRAGDPVACCLAAMVSVDSLVAVTKVVGASHPDTPLIVGGAAIASADQAMELGGTHVGADLLGTVELVVSLA